MNRTAIFLANVIGEAAARKTPVQFDVGSSYVCPGARKEHVVEVVVVMRAGSGGGSGVESDAWFADFRYQFSAK